MAIMQQNGMKTSKFSICYISSYWLCSWKFKQFYFITFLSFSTSSDPPDFDLKISDAEISTAYDGLTAAAKNNVNYSVVEYTKIVETINAKGIVTRTTVVAKLFIGNELHSDF